MVEAAPEKVMWGTDGSFDWHAEDDVYNLLIKFSNDFKGFLKSEHQELFSRKNAARLLIR